jgi:DNA-binding Lrp family transcriptional regulator
MNALASVADLETHRKGRQNVTSRWDVNRAVRKSDLPAPSRLIMLVLADVAEVGTCEIPEKHTPSLRVIADETGLNKATVVRHLDSLDDAGWIVRTKPTLEAARLYGERTKYRLTIPDHVAESDKGGRRKQQGHVAQDDKTMSQRATRPSRTERQKKSDLVRSSDPSSSELRPDVERICTHLADWVEKNGSKRPEIGKRWRTAARLMIDADGRDPEKIMRAIDWCQQDDFWRGNVLSMDKLRQKYDQLRLAAQRSPGRREMPPSNAPQRVTADEACPRHEYENAANCRACASESKGVAK